MDDATRFENEPAYYHVVGLLKELSEAKASNELLIAELGRIAQALGVDASMAKVLGKIAELKEKP